MYLGNIHLETSTEDLCNAIRGGVLKALDTCPISIFPLSHSLTMAFTFFQVASYQGLTLNNRHLKIGWGKNSGPATPGPHAGSTAHVQPCHIGMSLPESTRAIGSKLLEMQQLESHVESTLRLNYDSTRCPLDFGFESALSLSHGNTIHTCQHLVDYHPVRPDPSKSSLPRTTPLVLHVDRSLLMKSGLGKQGVVILMDLWR